MPESALARFSREAVPAVRADDLRRVWSFLAEQYRQAQSPGMSVDVKLLACLCSPNTDVLAVSARALFVSALLHQGRLESWREGDSLRDRVFELAAGFPLTKGLSGADSDGFVAALNQMA